MGRAAGLVIGLEAVAVVVAYLAFGWPVLVVGAPALAGTALVLLVVKLSEGLRETRAARYAEPPVSGGLMSGFFEVPAPRPTPQGDRTHA